MKKKHAMQRVSSQERKRLERIDENQRNSDATYLRQFAANCVRNFDIGWICKQLSNTSDVPRWYKSILTRMLVGWIVSPKNKRMRLALAWHHINDQFDLKARRAWKAQKEATKKSRGTRFSFYYVIASSHFLMGQFKYHYLYLALGGMNSKTHISLSEMRRLSAESAKGAKRCLQLVDVLVFLQKQGGAANIGEGNAILHDLRKQYKRTNENMFSNAAYDLQPIDSKNLEKYWPTAQPSAEFWSALYTISLSARKGTSDASAKSHVVPATNALDHIISNGIYSLPFGNLEFQQQLIGRAKYFSSALQSRKRLKLNDRFPQDLAPEPARLGIFVPSVLEAQKDAKPGTKRLILSKSAKTSVGKGTATDRNGRKL